MIKSDLSVVIVRDRRSYNDQEVKKVVLILRSRKIYHVDINLFRRVVLRGLEDSAVKEI